MQNIIFGTDNIPDGYFVDHINHCTSDNRRINLRLANISENRMNRRTFKNNLSKISGVRLMPSGNWQARICAYGKNICIGTFSTKEEAIEARKAAEIKYHKEFACDAIIVDNPIDMGEIQDFENANLIER